MTGGDPGRGVALASTRTELHEALAGSLGPVGLVPTMGALHAGHAELLRTARKRIGPGAPLVASVFVNPLQFAPDEDLERYPRTLDADLAVCAQAGVDVVFAPSVEEMYPGGVDGRGGPGPMVGVDPGPLGAVLEGASRPTHFRGVLTVVAKLFGLVRPDVAVFGEKDYQQLVLIRRMATDLCLGVEVRGAPTVRESDGLALSSRNRFLDPAQRHAATALSLALSAALAAGSDATSAVAAARAVLAGERAIDLDYLELRAPDLGPAPAYGEARLLVAARVGSTRLIDNLAIQVGGHPPGDDPGNNPGDDPGDNPGGS